MNLAFRKILLIRREPAFALVVTLCAVVFLSVLVLAFFSKSLLSRQVAFSSTNMTKADFLARYALDFATSELRQEIRDGSTALDSGNPAFPIIYQPSARTNALPEKIGIAVPDAAGVKTLAKVSANGTALRSSGTRTASDIAISTPSINSRQLSPGRWFGPNSPGLGSQNLLPTWFYVTRDNGIRTPSITDARNPRSADYVVGRFACTVYDVSGLLNANVAGSPAVALTNAAYKGSTTYADLTQLDASFTAGKAEAFVGWRDGAADTASAAAYETYLRDFGSRHGFAETKEGHNAFLGRKDLLNAAAAGLLTTGVTSNLTHFSRSITAPSWSPPNPAGSGIAYGDEANQASRPNRFVPNVRHPIATIVTHYRDDGRVETYAVQAGDPLLRLRFSLAKLAWLGPNGPKAGAFHSSLSAAQRAQAIEDCFGLSWDSVNLRWNYVKKAPSPVAIMTLDQVASQSREPNFFELLRAGILRGSIAQNPGLVADYLDTATPNNVVGPAGDLFSTTTNDGYSQEPNLHVMQIGANIIDQYDEDGYPTSVHFEAFASDPSAYKYEFFNTVHGIENLPYLSRLYLIAFQDSRPAPEAAWATPYNWKFFIQPELWNPHQAPQTAPASQPTEFRIRAYGGVRGSFSHTRLTGTPNFLVPTTIDYDTDPSYRDVYFLDTNSGKSSSIFYATPQVLSKTMADPGRTAAINLYDSALDSVNFVSGAGGIASPYNRFPYAGIYAGSVRYPKNLAVQPWNIASGFYTPGPRLIPADRLTLSLEFWDGANWRQYSRMARIAAMPARNSAGIPQADIASGQDGNLSLAGWTAIHGPDPRTDRFSISVSRTGGGVVNGTSWTPGKTAEAIAGTQNAIEDYYPASQPRTTPAIPVTETFPFSPTPANLITQTAKVPVAMWMINEGANPFAISNGGSTYNAYYHDADGMVRPADGFRRDLSTGDGIYLLHSANSPASATRRRPVILNRAFRSVAELGYAYRDLPGKNLDLWSASSGDSALLDLFAVSDQSKTTSDTVNPNAAPEAVLLSLLANTSAMEEGNLVLSSTDARPTASAISTFASSGTTPFVNPADLADLLGPTINTSLPAIIKNNKATGEAPARALGSVANSRTWQFLIDCVAQVGRFPSSASQLDRFTVEGERRYWLHLAIDRYTGKVVARQLESINE